jgi:transposase-like protein
MLFRKVSKSAIHKWVKAFSSKINLTVEKKDRKLIAVDESCIKRNGQRLYIWLAIDVNSKELLSYHVSVYRNSIEAYYFLKKALATCSNKPIVLVDSAPWYNHAFQRLHVDYFQQTFGRRNAVERLFRYVKERSKIFYNNINTKNLYKGIECIYLFLNLFAYYYRELR